MMFSVFTPTHDATYLGEAFASLSQQTDRDWQWVIVPNGDVSIDAAIADDPRVKIVKAPSPVASLGVGALKRFACDNCDGDYFVELDHDDILLPEALAKIRDAAARTGAGFIYSDFANFYENGTCQVYDAAFGWESYPLAENGRNYTAMRAFAADASGLSAIFYAPNHVRVWERNCYMQAGGHLANLPVCDDYDLLCRTYLIGAGFRHIPECLYLYRMHPAGAQTFLQRNQEIQDRQRQIANQYLHPMISEWCRRSNLQAIDLGQADRRPAGFAAIEGGGIEHVLLHGIPLPDNSAGCIRAFDVLSHAPGCAGQSCDHGASDFSELCVVGLMNEIYRVLAPGGWLISGTPSTEGRGAFQHPASRSFWNSNSFWYYTRKEQAQTVPGLSCRFQGTRVWNEFPTEWHKTNNIPYVYADLVALKGQRQPGICEI